MKTPILLISVCLLSSMCFGQIVKVNFKKSPQVFEPKSTFQVELADLDNDGDLDAVTANMHQNHGQILLNDGKGNFTDSGQELTDKGHGVVIGDIDSDGDLDIIMTCANRDRKTKIYFNDGDAKFTESEQDMNDFTSSGNCVDLFDIDGDSDLDFVVDYYLEPYGIFLNDGKGTFTRSEKSFPAGAAIIFGYINQDEYIDVFMKVKKQGYEVYLNDGIGNFDKYWEYRDTNTTHGYYSVAIDDFDGDGDNDAFICNGDNETSSESMYFINNGDGTFTDSGLRFSKTKWAWTRTGDLNNDGYIDIYISNFLIPNEIYINDGKGSFFNSNLEITFEETTRGFSLGDIDNDGDLDAFLGSFLKGSNEIWINCTKN